MDRLATAITRAWARDAPWLWLLAPLSALFAAVAFLRRRAYTAGLLRGWRAPVPVVVVGNITVGGTGKTPLVAALADYLVAAGYRPGIVSRGYGGRPPSSPLAVNRDTPAAQCGDEPLLLARRTGCPVVVDPDRPAAARCLVDQYRCDIVISDDGLQHYRLQRDIEIAVVDGSRGLGNRRLLPRGPLREPVSRLTRVDGLVVNGADTVPGLSFPAARMQLQASRLVALGSGECLTPDQWTANRRVHAVAGIGHPQRFFDTLRALGFSPTEHPFPDHHRFSTDDLRFADDQPVIMTEKDAVKCRELGSVDACWYLTIDAQLPADFFPSLVRRLTPQQPQDCP